MVKRILPVCVCWSTT